MPQILLRVDETEFKLLQEKSSEFGLSKAAFVRQIVKEHLRKAKQKEQPVYNLKHIRALIPIIAQALGRTQMLLVKGATEEDAKVLTVPEKEIEELSESLLQLYDQGVQ